MPLNDQQRQKLDGIVQQMASNGETDADIQAVVNDFKQKYGANLGFKGQMGEFGSTLAGTAKSLVPGTPEAQKAGGDIAYGLQHPVETVKNYLAKNGAVTQNAIDKFKQGDYAGGIAHSIGALARAVPGLTGLDDAITQSESGHPGAAAGAATATGLMAAAGARAPEIPGALKQGYENFEGMAARQAQRQAWGKTLKGQWNTQDKALQLATRALNPPAADAYWTQDMQRAMALTKAEEAARGHAIGDVPGNTLGLPIGKAQEVYQFGDAIDANADAEEHIWQPFEQKLLNPAKASGMTKSAAPIVDNVNNAISSYMKDSDPAAVAAATARARRLYMTDGPPDANGNPTLIPKRMGAGEFQANMRAVNAALKAEYAKSEGITSANVQMFPKTAALFAEKEALQDGYYGLLGDANGVDPQVPRDMMKAYGSLITQREALAANLNAVTGFEPGGLRAASPYAARAIAQAKLGEFRGMTSNAATFGAKMLSPIKGSGTLLREAYKNFGGKAPTWDIPEPTARPTPQAAPFTPSGYPMPPRMAPGLPPAGPPPSPGGAPPSWSMTMPPLLGPGGPPALAPGQPQLPPGMPGLPPPTEPFARGGTIGREARRSLASPSAPPPLPKAQAKQAVMNHIAGRKQQLDRSFHGMAKANKIASYGVPAGVLTDNQQAQYNSANGDLMNEQQQRLAQIDAIPDLPGQGPDPGMVPAAGGVTAQGPTNAIVGEAGPELIKHSDGRPTEMVSGAQQKVLGQNGSTDKVVPLEPFPKNGIIRGSANIPLSPEGEHESRALGHMVAAAGGLDQIVASDLARTQQTAKLVGEPGGSVILPPEPALRSWAMGQLEGQPVTKETDDAIQHAIHAAPDMPLAGQGPASTSPGESFNQFKGRVLPMVQRIMQAQASQPGSRIGVVTHNRDIKLIQGWLNAGMRPDLEVDKRELMKSGDAPGTIHKIAMGPDGRMGTEEFDPSKERTDPGVYLIRHAHTGWNAPARSMEHGS